MKRLWLILLLSIPLLLRAQDSKVVQRIIYIGDAGEADTQQGGVLSHAQARILPGKTNVIYLGDNIYPTGMGLPGALNEKETGDILKSQFEPMRAKGAPVYFIPGNHDWDRMGPQGLAKIKRQWEFITEQKDSLLKVVPGNGCADPYEIKINDSLVVIAFDSEWWLYLYSKENPDADCDCKTEDEIIARFKEILNRNRDKVIMLADHHPFISYGHHGGYYGIGDYFFPLTSVNKNLYIPLPGLGALYPVLRDGFPAAEDQSHPLYRTMVDKIYKAFEGFPNMMVVSGHEHGLQFNKDHDRIQVVSGSGAKEAFVKKGPHSLYAETKPGFVIADLLADKSIKFTYYAGVDTVYSQVFTYTKPYVPIQPLKLITAQPIAADSIIVKARPDFDRVNPLHRKIYGENYRKEWAAAVKLPVIKISTFKGGLTPVRLGSVHQTSSLLLKDASGKEWILSSIEKYPEITLPQQRRETFAKSWFSDALSAQHPYAAMVVPVLARAVKVAHTNPVIGYVSPDRRLSFYEPDFAGKICVIEEANPGNRSDNTGVMMKQLDRNDNNRVDTLEFLRARLLDWFIGDWNQQQDQWRWVNRSQGNFKYYSALPRDRDQTFFVNQGIIPNAASAKWMSPYLKGYTTDKDYIKDFYFNGHELDSRFLSGIDLATWDATAKLFAANLTDSVLEAALRRLPLAAYNIRHKTLLKQMQYRRDHLVAEADKYYSFFNRVVDFKATDDDEVFIVKDTIDNNLLVAVYKRSKRGYTGSAIYTKIFDHTVTREVRIYAGKGNDSVSIDDKSGLIKVRVIGGRGQKVYNVASTNQHTKIYGKQSDVKLSGAAAQLVTRHFSNDSTTVSYQPVNLFNTTIPILNFGYNPDDGVWAQGGVRVILNGFRKSPGQIQQITYMHGFGNNANRVDYTGEWLNTLGKPDLEINARIYTPQVSNFFGAGNDSPFNKTGAYKDYYRARYDLIGLDAYARFHNRARSTFVRIGPAFEYYHYQPGDNLRLIDQPNLIHNYDSTSINKDKLHAGINVWYVNDKRNSAILPAYGVYISLKLQGLIGLNGYSNSFTQFIPQVQLIKSVTTNSSFVINNTIGGGLTLGRPAFYQLLYLGGPENLAGLRQYRYAGTQMLYDTFSARYKFNVLAPYILPGQYGITATYGIGRVWGNNISSKTWHNSLACGFYFAPADMALLQIQTGYSKDGWYPFVTLKLNI
ncbi:metallophosphoesterase [Mucilaginibacter ginkgonis]|uniref:Metallophosphoesterase n=1 Tax=Mucilaginibacter ginkgonis TaxID=2682091 RepID=A0A6I4I7R4_9SPHI|nr:metallophosphoesterase [Mucilaginibacter ginkgonis]QQL49080.1 metallophosphoesterase [Mucilaginibacter ginkgonis]